MTPALEFHGVCKRYDGFELDEVSFALPRGYIMGLIGPNGAGKTTLLKLALGLARTDGGRIEVFGRDHILHGPELRSRIGFVPEEARFHEDISLHNLKSATAPFYPDWDERRFADLADAFELPLERKFRKLSQGMKTKFALALALAHQPELLILDEPTSGLDPVFRRELLGRLSELLLDDQVSVLFSTHLTADLERTADYITFVQDGRLVFSRPKDDVLNGFALVKGGLELLDRCGDALFEGVRRHGWGFEALTSRADEVRRVLGSGISVERVTLDDMMVLLRTSAKEMDHAA